MTVTWVIARVEAGEADELAWAESGKTKHRADKTDKTDETDETDEADEADE
jgi:hypothetical protein